LIHKQQGGKRLKNLLSRTIYTKNGHKVTFSWRYLTGASKLAL